MGIFKEMSVLLGDGQQLTITLRKVGQSMAASVMPDVSGVKDKAVGNIVPIVLEGTPDEFDEGFVEALKQGIPQASGLVSNIREYEESVENAKKATEMAKKEKDDKEKARREFNGYINLAKQNLAEDKFLDAKKCLEKAGAVKDADKALIDRIKVEIANKSGEGALFAGPVDRSDGKNLVPGKEPVKPSSQTAQTVNPDKTANAFEQAIELSDDDDAEQEYDNSNEEE